MMARIWRNRNSHSLLVGIQTGTATLEDSLAVSNKTKPTLTTSPNMLLAVYPNEVNTYILTKIYTWMFTTA